MKYSAIDLHSNNSVVVVSDDVDRVLVRRRLPNDAATILAPLAAHQEELVGVVVESTYNWYRLPISVIFSVIFFLALLV